MAENNSDINSIDGSIYNLAKSDPNYNDRYQPMGANIQIPSKYIDIG